jgi:hypothetical protein
MATGAYNQKVLMGNWYVVTVLEGRHLHACIHSV